jgi:5-methylcytosine-specific restriction endonuclease McrA
MMTEAEKLEKRRVYRSLPHVIERRRLEVAKYRREHPGQRTATDAKYREKKRNERRAQSAAYRLAHPGCWRKSCEKYRESHPEKCRENQHARRARLMGSGGRGVTSEDIALQMKQQKGRCWWCGFKLTDYHVDHRIALAAGGEHDPSNIVISCPHCNVSKLTKTPAEFCGRLL